MKRICILFLLVYLAYGAVGQNLALNATVTASASSSGNYGPSNWNDGNIGPQYYFGWLGTAPNFAQPAWLKYEWNTPQTLNRLVFHPPTWSQPGYVYFAGSAQVQYWDSTGWVNHHSFQVNNPGLIDTVAFPAVTTTKVRVTNFVVLGQDNPGWDEIQVFYHQVIIPPQPDVEVCELVAPDDTVAINVPLTVIAKICNVGDDTLYQIPVSYYPAGGVAPTSETIQVSAGFVPGDTLLYVFIMPLMVQEDTSYLCVYTELLGDINHANDTLCKFLYVPVVDHISYPDGGSDDLFLKNFFVYPQPALQEMTIERIHPVGDVPFIICNIQGQRVFEGVMNDGVRSVVIDASQWGSGIYLLQLNGVDHVARKKIILGD